jgi:predicted O-methyltransferase YrrM
MKALLNDLLAARHRAQALAGLRRLEAKLPSPASRFAVPFVFSGRGHFRKIEPKQNPTEIEACYRAVVELHPARVLEIGTARGGSLYLWTQAATADALLVSLDLPGGKYGGAYPECRAPFYEAFARPGQRLILLRGDSHSAESRARVQELFAGQPLDFLFIDGDHTYDGAKADFLHYGPRVRAGGLIGFHDIVHRDDDPTIAVDRLWAELRERYETQSLIAPADAGRRIGIGLLRVPPGGLGLPA